MISTGQLTALLDILCPMYAIVSPAGRIEHAGPTLQKLRPDRSLRGAGFLDLFELARPRRAGNIADLLERSGTRLHLRLRESPGTALKGVIVALPGGQGGLVNLSFGISVLDAVRDYGLSASDFPATDLAVEMLYLVEAKSAAMEASRKLNLRLRDAMTEAEERAMTDTLTGLRNRRALHRALQGLVESGRRFALMQLDLDFFKQVNDTLGHGAGDFVLRHVARIMEEETRDTDLIARTGGDEFVLVLDRLTHRDRLETIAAKLIERIAKPIPYGSASCRVSTSIGIVVSPRHGLPDSDGLLRQADLALYAAKRAGRSVYRFFTADMADQRAEGGPDTGEASEDAAEEES